MRLYKDLIAFIEHGNKQCSRLGKIAKVLHTIILNPCFQSIALFRLSNALYKSHIPVLPRILFYINRLLFHVEINYRADLGGGVCLVHGLGVVIGYKVKTTGSVTIYQGVTLGGIKGKVKEENGMRQTQPIINNNVIIYSGASVLGPVTVAEGTVIAAKALLLTDTEPGSTWAGIPARKIR